jgi:hypothetical protein
MYTHFRGTTFQFTGQMQDDGVVQDLTDCILLASVFDPQGISKYGDLSVLYVDRLLGIVELHYPDTSTWPVGKARIDFTLQLANGETVASPPDFFRVAQTPMIG